MKVPAITSTYSNQYKIGTRLWANDALYEGRVLELLLNPNELTSAERLQMVLSTVMVMNILI